MFDIRYVKLHFALKMVEDSYLPVNKSSALRGGMGEMLLRSCCVGKRKCEECDFKEECIVQRILYSKMEIQPSFMTSGDSVGYVIECEDYREEIEKGDVLKFQLIIFGKTIVYFSQFLDAFYKLGMQGIGKHHARYVIAEIKNTKGETILKGNDIDMSRYNVMLLRDYVEYRKKRQKEISLIKFKSPLTLKHNGEFIDKFQIDAIMKALSRRIYILNCFEGIDEGAEAFEGDDLPGEGEESHRSVRVRRYSNHRDLGMTLRGIEGELRLSEVSEKAMEYLFAGEITHIGKNTSFGFGRYRCI